MESQRGYDSIISVDDGYDLSHHGPLMTKSVWKMYRRSFDNYEWANNFLGRIYVEGAKYAQKMIDNSEVRMDWERIEEIIRSKVDKVKADEICESVVKEFENV